MAVGLSPWVTPSSRSPSCQGSPPYTRSSSLSTMKIYKVTGILLQWRCSNIHIWQWPKSFVRSSFRAWQPTKPKNGFPLKQVWYFRISVWERSNPREFLHDTVSWSSPTNQNAPGVRSTNQNTPGVRSTNQNQQRPPWVGNLPVRTRFKTNIKVRGRLQAVLQVRPGVQTVL